VRDLDVDPSGTRAVVIASPRAAHVIDVATGATIGNLAPPKYRTKRVREVDARFSPTSDHLFAAYSRVHRIQKLSYRGRAVGDLEQPSAWCTPLATSPDRRWLASRQSGVGVVAWDLTTERELFFAELDPSTPYQEKFAKRGAAEPTAIKQIGGGFIKITRWKAAPELQGEATAIGVAPRCAYVATGGADGHVTIVDEATRRIERSDGRIIQRPVLLQTVALPGNPETAQFCRFGAEVFVLSREGTVTTVDLTTGEARAPGTIEIDPTFRLHASGDDVVVIDGQRARCYERRSLALRWSHENPLPSCTWMSFDGRLLVGLAEKTGDEQSLVRFDPVAGAALDAIPVSLASTSLHRDGGGFTLAVAAGRGRWLLEGHTYDGHRRFFPIAPDGALAAPLEKEACVLDDFAHVRYSEIDSWRIERIADRAVVAESTAAGLSLSGFIAVDLEARRVAACELHTQRVLVLTLEGERVSDIDAVGNVHYYTPFLFAPGATSLWVHERFGLLRRFRVA
jgi:hypothetical protein